MRNTNRLVATSTAALLTLAASASLAAAGNATIPSVQPLQAISLDVGPKHLAGYFLNEDGRCKMTLMIGDVWREEARDEAAAPVMRVQLTFDASQPALIDTAGKVLEFKCQPGAQALNAALRDQVAYRLK